MEAIHNDVVLGEFHKQLVTDHVKRKLNIKKRHYKCRFECFHNGIILIVKCFHFVLQYTEKKSIKIVVFRIVNCNFYFIFIKNHNT